MKLNSEINNLLQKVNKSCGGYFAVDIGKMNMNSPSRSHLIFLIFTLTKMLHCDGLDIYLSRVFACLWPETLGWAPAFP